MAETKHTEEAIRAARELIHTIFDGYAIRGDYLNTIATIISRETHSRTLQARIDKLEVEKAELVKALKAISAISGNLSLDRIEKVNGINDGKSKGIMLKLAVELARKALKEKPDELIP